MSAEAGHPCAGDIAVVIPLFNKAAFVARAVRSVLAQTGGPPVIVVVDDGSTDGGADAVLDLKVPRLCLIQQPNRGAAAARNRGIREAPTDCVALLDADDEWQPGFLRAVRELRARFPRAGAWATAYASVGADGRRALPPFRHVPTAPDGGLIADFFRAIAAFPPVCSSNVLCPRTVFEEVGYFPEGEVLAEDWDMWTRIALRHPIAFAPEVLALYHQGAANRAAERHRFAGSDTALARTLRQALSAGGLPDATAESVRAFLGKHLLEVAKHAIEAGQSRRARGLIRDVGALRTLPLKRLRWWIRSWLPRPTR